MAGDPTCIFCRIVAGQIPALKVFEDAASLAFLDVAPLAEGHTLLIPKRHAAQLDDLSADEAAALARRLPALVRAIRGATGAAALNVLQNNGRESGQAVFHVHIHLIPRRADDGLGYRWNAGKYPPGRGEQLCEAVREALAR